jgi:uncharacterized protein (TIGR02118 family)
MHKLVVLYRHPADPEHFRSYYEGTHLPLAQRMTGIVSMRHSFDLHGIGGASPYFCIFECVFENAEAMAAAMASPEGQAVGADVPNYAQAGVEMFHMPVPDAS